MFQPTHSRSSTHRVVAILIALAVLVAGQAAHVPMVQADADVGGPHALTGNTSDSPVLDTGDGMSSADGAASELDCAGTECGNCAATVTSSVPHSPSLHGLPSDHAVIDSAVRPPERLFRPPIQLA